MKELTHLCSCVRGRWDCCIFHTLFCSLHRSSECWKEVEVTFIRQTLLRRYNVFHQIMSFTSQTREMCHGIIDTCCLQVHLEGSL